MVFKSLNVSERKKEAVQGIIMVTCWSLWRARNNVRFSNSLIRIENIISDVKVLSFFWFSSRSKNKGIGWEEWCSFVNM
ncbi:hypothetical protein Hanom_Chr16g01456911 [Helianthus anomalus]